MSGPVLLYRSEQRVRQGRYAHRLVVGVEVGEALCCERVRWKWGTIVVCMGLQSLRHMFNRCHLVIVSGLRSDSLFLQCPTSLSHDVRIPTLNPRENLLKNSKQVIFGSHTKTESIPPPHYR